MASQLNRPGFAAQAVRFRQPRQQLQIDFLSQAPEGAVADLVLRLEPHARLEVLRHHAQDLPAHVVSVERVDIQPIEKRGGRRDSLLLVIDRADPPIEEGGRRRLAEVVADRAEHDGDLLRARQVVDALPRLIDDLQRVHPDVSLGMPLGLLRTADEGARAPGTGCR